VWDRPSLGYRIGLTTPHPPLNGVFDVNLFRAP